MTRSRTPTRIQISLTPRELTDLLEAIDSRIYWDLSDTHYRRDGFVMPPGSDDPEARTAMRRLERLAARLQQEART